LATSRRDALSGLALALIAPATARAQGGALHGSARFGEGYVEALAAELARTPYVAPAAQAGAAASALDWGAYRKISFRRERELWAGQGHFRADFLPAGYIFPRAVEVYEVAQGRARPILFDPADYAAPAELAEAVAGIGGFSGLRLKSPINRPEVFDEIAVFQGASYFRSLGRGNAYGLSARGVALGTGGAGREEFPAFRSFWIERPRPDAEAVVVHALMDGPSLTGAYRFVISPGAATTFEVEASLFPRRDIADGGVGVATSMFLFGPADREGIADPRDAAHDSEGLEIWTGEGRRIWRPLTNPAALQISAHEDVSPRGFGLMQRSRSFAAYGDLDLKYEKRPSLWIEPRGAWGKGSVQLVEIPTRTETFDNIVAFWRPAEAWTAGAPQRLAWRLHWGMDHPYPGPGARVIATRAGGGRFLVDFQGVQGQARATATASAGQAGPVRLSPLPDSGLLRADFSFQPPSAGLADLELRLAGDAGDLSETWRYRWTAA
jgi:glucans biosynthesis protein